MMRYSLWDQDSGKLLARTYSSHAALDALREAGMTPDGAISFLWDAVAAGGDAIVRAGLTLCAEVRA